MAGFKGMDGTASESSEDIVFYEAPTVEELNIAHVTLIEDGCKWFSLDFH